MHLLSRQSVVIMAALCLAGAAAQADPRGELLTYASRPLTLPAGVIRLDGSFAATTDQFNVTTVSGGSSMASPTTQTFSVLTLGGAVGITDNFQLSVHEAVWIGTYNSPQDQFNASDDPYIRGLYRFVSGAFEAAGELTVAVPVQAGQGVGVTLGVPILVRVSNVGRFDFIPRFELDSASPHGTAPAKYAQLQVYYEQQLSEGFTVGLHAAVIGPNESPTSVQVPLGLLGRLSLPRANGTTLGDVILAFDFNRLFTGPTSGIDASAYTISMAGRLFFAL